MTGLLDGGLASVFGAAFGGIYLPATLRKETRTEATDGTISTTPAIISCRAQVDTVTEAMRRAEGYSDRDVRILVLTSGVMQGPVIGDQILVKARNYAIASVDLDAAASHWVIRARPV